MMHIIPFDAFSFDRARQTRRPDEFVVFREIGFGLGRAASIPALAQPPALD